MADRVTRVRLEAVVSGYISGMDAAAKKTKETASAAEKLNAQKQGLEALGKAGMAVGALAAASAAIAVAKFAEFDAAMSKVQAATHETAANMQLLRDAAIQAGDSTVFSAAEAAGAIEELAKAGVSTADILNGGLAGALDLAASGGLAVADAAGIASTALAQFKLAGSDVGHVADLLAAGAGKAMGDVTDLSQALAQGGQVASATGLSIEETTAALSAFASQGLLGSDAGTSFKSMLQRLNPSTAEAERLMKDLNLSAYDASGNFIGLSEYAGKLQSGLSGLTTEQRQSTLATLFGSDAIRAATVLYSEGAEGISEWEANVDDAGYAAETARIRLDNLKGDLEKLGGSIDTVLIQGGSAANDSLRSLVQGATSVVDAIGDLPEPVLNTGLAAAGLAGTVGLVGGAALLAVPKIAEFKSSLAALNIAGSSVARSVGGVSAALGVAGAAFAVWAQRQAEAKAITQALEDSLDESTGAITDYTREVVAKHLAEKGAFDAAKDAGISQKELTDAVLEGGDALQSVQDKISGNNNLVNFFTGVGVRAGDASRALDDLAEALPDARQNLDDQKAAAAGSAEATGTAAEAYMEASDQASSLVSNLQELISTVNEANGVGQDAVSANLDYKNALADVDETIRLAREGAEGYALTLDTNTQAGRDNLDMLNSMAASSQSAAEKQFALDGNTESYRATLEAGRQALLDRATQLGMNADEAGKLADQIYRIPDSTEWAVIAETAKANADLQRFVETWDGRQINVSLMTPNQAFVAANLTKPNANGGMHSYSAFANGGIDEGFYSGRAGGIHKFAEPETRWEAYISGKPGQEARNRIIALNALERLGGGNYTYGGGQPVVNNYNYSVTNDIKPIRDNDPHATATVMGREIGRRLAGSNF